MKTSAEEMQEHVGKTIARNELDPPPSSSYVDDDGFYVHFTDGTKVRIGADMGQGSGFVVIEEDN